MQVGNLRFQKTMVFNPSTELAAAGIRPDQLVLGNVGFFDPRTNLSVAAAGIAGLPTLVAHQNIGDNKFGTVRTRTINAQQVTGWRGARAKAGRTQISYFGWNTTDGDLACKVGQDIIFVITLYDNELRKIYGATGYTKRLVPNPSVYQGLFEGDAIDQSKLADDIVAQINGTDFPAGAFPTNGELKNFVVATKVTDGAGKYGIKIETIAPTVEKINRANPKQFHKPNTRNFAIGTSIGVAFKTKTTQVAFSGTGWPLEVTDLEKESQGYDRVRDQFEHDEHMKTPFILRAQDGVQYDFYFLDFESSHDDTGLPKKITDPYTLILPVPTGTGATLEALLNAWLTPLGFVAVDIDAAENVKGDENVVNA